MVCGETSSMIQPSLDQSLKVADKETEWQKTHEVLQ